MYVGMLIASPAFPVWSSLAGLLSRLAEAQSRPVLRRRNVFRAKRILSERAVETLKHRAGELGLARSPRRFLIGSSRRPRLVATIRFQTPRWLTVARGDHTRFGRCNQFGRRPGLDWHSDLSGSRGLGGRKPRDIVLQCRGIDGSPAGDQGLRLRGSRGLTGEARDRGRYAKAIGCGIRTRGAVFVAHLVGVTLQQREQNMIRSLNLQSRIDAVCEGLHGPSR